MIEVIQVRFMHPTDGRIITVTLDDNITPEEIISELTSANFIDSLIKSSYSIAIKGGLVLKYNESLSKNNIHDGDTLRIIPRTDAG